MENVRESLMNAELDDLYENPGKFGLPTLAEFSRNPGKWRAGPEDTFITLSDGTKIVKNIRRHIYYVAGEVTESLERVQKVCEDEGWGEVSFIPELRQDVSGKLDAHIEVLPKAVAEERIRNLQIERAIKGAGINPLEVGK